MLPSRQPAGYAFGRLPLADGDRGRGRGPLAEVGGGVGPRRSGHSAGVRGANLPALRVTTEGFPTILVGLHAASQLGLENGDGMRLLGKVAAVTGGGSG